MKSLLLLTIIHGWSVIFVFFIIFLVDSNFQVNTDYFLQGVLLISLACGVITFFLYKFYKKMKWDNDFIYLFIRTRLKRIYLFIRTRLKRGSQKIESAKNKMRRELDDDS